MSFLYNKFDLLSVFVSVQNGETSVVDILGSICTENKNCISMGKLIGFLTFSFLFFFKLMKNFTLIYNNFIKRLLAKKSINFKFNLLQLIFMFFNVYRGDV